MLVADAAEEACAGRFGFFEFALVGIPLLAGTIAIALLLGKRLLPVRMPERVPPDFSAHLRTLAHQYGLESPPVPSRRPQAVITSQMGMAEVIIPPRSGLVGTTVFPGMVTESGDLVILAVQRGGEDLDTTSTVLAVGDTLLLQGAWAALDENLSDPDVLVVDLPENVRRQAAPLGTSAKWTLGLLAGMVVLLATGLVPVVVAGLLAACGLILLRVMTVTQAYRAISWTTVVLVAGMTSLSVGMQTTGAANLIADTLVQVVRDLGPYALLIGLFIITATLGQLISNMATALIVLPIALSAASEMGVAVEPVLMSVWVAAAAALLTPVATPANLMVMGPSGLPLRRLHTFRASSAGVVLHRVRLRRSYLLAVVILRGGLGTPVPLPFPVRLTPGAVGRAQACPASGVGLTEEELEQSVT